MGHIYRFKSECGALKTIDVREVHSVTFDFGRGEFLALGGHGETLATLSPRQARIVMFKMVDIAMERRGEVPDLAGQA